MKKLELLQKRLETVLSSAILSSDLFRKELTLTAPANAILAIAQILKEDQILAFDMLMDLCVIDYLSYGQSEWMTDAATANGFSRGCDEIQTDFRKQHLEHRYGVVYHLLSLTHCWRVRLKVYLSDASPTMDSVCDIWPGADWFEREAFDLFGVIFKGHPDLRRILTDYGFVGHPMRKDFPISGHVEMRYDATEGRVIYEPISIEPRTLVPRVIRTKDCVEPNFEFDQIRKCTDA